jgi:hypothetical protein
MYLTKIWFKYVDWIYLTKYRDQGRVVVNTIM